MKKNSTQLSQQMETTTLSRRQSPRGPRNEVLSAIRQFARAYRPIGGNMFPGVVLN